MNVLFDTNILIDCLHGNAAALHELERYPEAMISVINWIEVMFGARTPEEREQFRKFLFHFKCMSVDEKVAEQAALLRQRKMLKLPDALILATAQVHRAVLITRDSDFPVDVPGVRVPYRL